MGDKIVYSYIDEIGKRLGEPGIYGAASLMVGAGFSKNADCLGDKKNTPPDWTQLSEAMYEELYPFEKQNEKRRWEECSGKNVLTLAQKYEVTFDRQALNSLIERSISDKSYVPGDLHRNLLELNWNDIFTTNYDTLLERAIEQVATRKNYKIVYSQDDLPGSVRPRLVKLHGSIEHSSNYIITEEDYRTYPDKYAPFVNTVQQSMLETRLCLIGFSGSDPNFLSWLGWLRDNMGENCPSIYLCGVFDNLGTAERKMLEQRHITIVDLSVLVDDKEKNRHYNAIKKFIELLKEKSEKKKETILKEKPYSDVNIFVKKEKLDIEKYVKDMMKVMNRLTEKLDDYICLPLNETGNIGEYIESQLRFVLNQNSFDKKNELINYFCAILKKCNYPLYDDFAEKLRVIVDDTNFEVNIKNDIIMCLLQKYRLDGKFDDYLKVKKVVDNIEFDTIGTKNEYWIECVKFYMCTLNINEAYKCLEKIEISNYDEFALKKASLLCQLDRKDEAKEIITSTVAFVSQQKYSENKNASIIGYANLVARSAWTKFDGQELFSDSLYEDNIFNCRKIVINSKDSIIETIFENQRPQNRKISSFNPNSYTISYTMGSTNEGKKMEASFKYLLLQDLLCLRIYRDHKNATETAIKSVDNTSESPLWRWYIILKINDDNIYNLYFTRERIYDTELSFVERFFDEIICILEECIGETKNNVKLFVDCKTLTDIASKMTIVLDEDRIVKLINKLIQIDATFKDEHKKASLIKSSLNIIYYSFNSKVFKKCINFILDNKLIDYSFISYFDDNECIVVEDVEQQFEKRLFESIAEELDSEDLQIRDTGVIKYKLFEKQIISSDYKKEIVGKLWSHTDEFGLPINNTYLPIAWKNDTMHNAEQKIIDYLLKPQISRNFNSGIIYGDNLADGQVWGYYNVLYQMIIYKKNNIFSKEQLCELIEYFGKYVENEKNIIENRYDIFGKASEVRKRFCMINDIILLLCVCAKVSKVFNKELGDKIKYYIEQMDSIEVDTENIKIILSDIEVKSAFMIFEKKIMYVDEEDISSAFTMLFGIIQISQSQGNEAVIDQLILRFVEKIPYFEIGIGKRVVLDLHNMLKREVFLKDENKEQVVNVLNTCFDIYNNAKEEHGKDGLDGMFNVSNLSKTYYKFLKESDSEIGGDFENLIAKFKNCKLNEIKNHWS
ncbi:MAG: SIR2 family protein [Lachnospiraceae bacterium]|nr:SIR2 family protein [Lachnospiraceae bacterium]